MNNGNVPHEEEAASSFRHSQEIFFVIAGLILFYMRFEPLAGASVAENFLGYVGSLFGGGVLGAGLIGFIPYLLIRNKIKNPALKVFSVTFFLAGLLMVLSR